MARWETLREAGAVIQFTQSSGAGAHHAWPKRWHRHVIGPWVRAQDRTVVALPARHVQQPHAVGAHVAAPWRADTMPGGCVVRDANGWALVYGYSRDDEAARLQHNVDAGFHPGCLGLIKNSLHFS
jgi:hypothetical protein